MTDTLSTAVPEQRTDAAADDEARRDALAERLFAAALGGIELLTVELGRRLNLYAAVQADGAVTAAQLARRAGIAERYAREWLEQQAEAGILDVAEDTGEPDTRRFAIPAGHATVLLEEEHPSYLMALAPALTSLGLAMPAVTEAYRTGAGVNYAAYGEELRHGLSGLNRPMFVNELGDWLATMPDVVDRLREGADVLDVGCGVGWSSIAMARAYPRIRVRGIDLDRASITEARVNAQAAGVADRVSFQVGDAASVEATGDGRGYALVTVFEALHDMGEPIQALRGMRAALAPGGVVFIADESVADEFTTPVSEAERFQFAWSVLHCLPATMAESTAVASGTVLRTPTVRAWVEQAGYAGLTVQPIENFFWRFYRLDP